MIRKLLDKTFWKFILVGILNTLFVTGIMFLLYNVVLRDFQDRPWAYWVSSAANYILGSVLSFFLNKYFTFRYKKNGWRVVLRFSLNIAVCYLIAYGAAKPLAVRLLSQAPGPIQENVAMLVGMGLFVLLNYAGQRFFAFRQEREKGPGEE
jgi:putative flippase GtrA